MPTGHSQLITPTSTSEFHSMCDALRSHHHAMHGQASDVAAALRGILPDVIKARGGARAGLMGQDAKIMARRIVQPLQAVAALDNEIARLYVVAYTRYTQYVVNVPKTQPANRFNADG